MAEDLNSIPGHSQTQGKERQISILFSFYNLFQSESEQKGVVEKKSWISDNRTETNP